jgi:hypothetical protein
MITSRKGRGGWFDRRPSLGGPGEFLALGKLPAKPVPWFISPPASLDPRLGSRLVCLRTIPAEAGSHRVFGLHGPAQAVEAECCPGEVEEFGLGLIGDTQREGRMLRLDDPWRERQIERTGLAAEVEHKGRSKQRVFELLQGPGGSWTLPEASRRQRIASIIAGGQECIQLVLRKGQLLRTHGGGGSLACLERLGRSDLSGVVVDQQRTWVIDAAGKVVALEEGGEFAVLLASKPERGGHEPQDGGTRGGVARGTPLPDRDLPPGSHGAMQAEEQEPHHLVPGVLTAKSTS